MFLLTNPPASRGMTRGGSPAWNASRWNWASRMTPAGAGRCPRRARNSHMDCDLAIIAVGSGANPLLTQSTPDLKLNQWGYIMADPETGKTSKKGRLGRGGHRDRRGHGYSGHGGRAQGGGFDSRLSHLGLVVLRKGHLLAPGGVLASWRPRRSVGYACGTQSAAALPGTPIYPLPADTVGRGAFWPLRRSRLLGVLGVAWATPAVPSHLRP
jgi:hypothetical protein